MTLLERYELYLWMGVPQCTNLLIVNNKLIKIGLDKRPVEMILNDWINLFLTNKLKRLNGNYSK